MKDECPARLLSSDLTFLFKYIVFPALLVAFGAGILLAVLSPESIPTEWGRGLFGLGMLVGFMAIATMYTCAYAKIERVELKGNTLRISTLHGEMETPVGNMRSVSGSLLMYPELVWLTFRQPTPFGDKIVSIGKYRVLAGWTLHPVVNELREQLLQNDQQSGEGAK